MKAKNYITRTIQLLPRDCFMDRASAEKHDVDGQHLAHANSDDSGNDRATSGAIAAWRLHEGQVLDARDEIATVPSASQQSIETCNGYNECNHEVWDCALYLLRAEVCGDLADLKR